VEVFVSAVEALDVVLRFLHSDRRVHGDLSPSNILVSTTGARTVRINDFGASIRIGEFLTQKTDHFAPISFSPPLQVSAQLGEGKSAAESKPGSVKAAERWDYESAFFSLVHYAFVDPKRSRRRSVPPWERLCDDAMWAAKTAFMSPERWAALKAHFDAIAWELLDALHNLLFICQPISLPPIRDTITRFVTARRALQTAPKAVIAPVMVYASLNKSAKLYHKSANPECHQKRHTFQPLPKPEAEAKGLRACDGCFDL